METESPSPYPHVPATCPYPEPTPSSLHDPLELPEDPSQYYPPIFSLTSSDIKQVPASHPAPPFVCSIPHFLTLHVFIYQS